MNAVATLLADLRSRDVRLEMRGDRLRIDAPTGVLTSETVARIRVHKAAIMAVLGSQSGPTGAQDVVVCPDDLTDYWREFYEERAAIREFCGEQAREHAEAEALKETIAAMRRDHHSARLASDN